MLTYDLLPAAEPPADPAKRRHCLVLHGLGDSMDGWKPVAPMIGIAALGFAFANAPLDYHGGFSWFDLGSDMRPDDAGVRRSRAAVDELIAHLLKELKIPSGQLFLMGFSQGCLMTLDVGLRSPRRFAGLVGISGFMTMLDEFPAALGAPAREQDILMTHGRQDPMIPIQAVRRQKDALLRLGLKLEWREYDKVHTLDPQDELDDIRAWIDARMG